MTSVHPHACGEHTDGRRNDVWLAGSPPRMWGTRSTYTYWQGGGLVHPHACGEHASGWRQRVPQKVHPHACGEHVSGCTPTSSVIGSPPRMWGTPPDLGHAECGPRFTPTHVGNTNILNYGKIVQTVHPHACGEHFYRLHEWRVNDGSPPRMWGTRGGCPRAAHDPRFTPTHVGNTPMGQTT